MGGFFSQIRDGKQKLIDSARPKAVSDEDAAYVAEVSTVISAWLRIPQQAAKLVTQKHEAETFQQRYYLMQKVRLTFYENGGIFDRLRSFMELAEHLPADMREDTARGTDTLLYAAVWNTMIAALLRKQDVITDLQQKLEKLTMKMTQKEKDKAVKELLKPYNEKKAQAEAIKKLLELYNKKKAQYEKIEKQLSNFRNDRKNQKPLLPKSAAFQKQWEAIKALQNDVEQLAQEIKRYKSLSTSFEDKQKMYSGISTENHVNRCRALCSDFVELMTSEEIRSLEFWPEEADDPAEAIRQYWKSVQQAASACEKFVKENEDKNEKEP